MFESIFLRIFAIPLRFLAQTGRNMIQWASGIAGRCAVRPKQRNSAPPNGEGRGRCQNRTAACGRQASRHWPGPGWRRSGVCWFPAGRQSCRRACPARCAACWCCRWPRSWCSGGAAAPAAAAGEHPANLCQAVLFAALHGTLTEKCYALGMGLIFGWAAEQTDSPAPGVVLHILNNGLVLARALAERGMG